MTLLRERSPIIAFREHYPQTAVQAGETINIYGGGVIVGGGVISYSNRCAQTWSVLTIGEPTLCGLYHHTLARRNPTATPSHSSAPSIARTFCSTSWVSSSTALPSSIVGERKQRQGQASKISWTSLIYSVCLLVSMRRGRRHCELYYLNTPGRTGIQSNQKFTYQWIHLWRAHSLYLTSEGAFQIVGKGPQRSGCSGPPLEATDSGMG